MELTERKIKELSRYNGLILDVRVDEIALPDGRSAKREIVEHPGGVTVLPMDAQGMVYCVRQYRYAFEREMLEVPAGKLEPGEEPDSAAKRELSEETGITAGRWDDLGVIQTSPGFCTEQLYLYLARDLHFGSAHPDEGEFLSVEKHSLTELAELAMHGGLVDAKTVAAVLKAERLLRMEKEETK